MFNPPARRLIRLAAALALCVAAHGAAAQSVALKVAVSDDPVRAGQRYIYYATVANPHPATTYSDVRLRTRLPLELKEFYANQALDDGGTCDGNASGYCYARAGRFSQIEWSFGDLAPGESRRVRLPVTARADLTDDTEIELRFEIVHTGIGSTIDETVLVVVRPEPAGAVMDVQVAAPGPATPGELLTYTLQFANQGSAQANGVELTARLPDDVTFVSASDGASAAGGQVSWPVGFVAAGSGDRRWIRVRVAEGLAAGSILYAGARISDDVDADVDASDGVATPVYAGEQPFELAVEISDDPVYPSGRYEYRITVSNVSGQTYHNVELATYLPLQTQELYAHQSFGYEAACNGDASGYCYNRDSRYSPLVWTFARLNPGDTRTARMPVTARADLPPGALIAHHLRIRHAGPGFAKTVSELVRVADPDDSRLRLRLSGVPDPVAPQGTLDYTLGYGYREGGRIAAADLYLRLPGRTALISADSAVTVEAGLLRWRLEQFDDGTGNAVTVRVRADTGLDGALLLAEAWLEDELDGNVDARTSNVVAVNAPQPLRLTLEVDNDIADGTLQPGGSYVYKVTVHNDSGTTFSNVEIHTWLQEFMNEFYAHQTLGDNATCDGNASGYCYNRPNRHSPIVWTIDRLDPGGRRTVELPVTLRTGIDAGQVLETRFETRYLAQGAVNTAAVTSALVVGALGVMPVEPGSGGLIFANGFE